MMPEQREIPEATEPEDETVSNEAEKRIEHVAEKAAERGSKTVHNYDKDQTIFSN